MKRWLIVLTDERPGYLQKTINSARERLMGRFDHQLILDDSGYSPFGQWLERTFPEFEIVHNKANIGRMLTMARMWEMVRGLDFDFVFFLQNDFTFNVPIDVDHMQSVMMHRPKLAQIALMRQPWNAKEKECGGILAKDGGRLYEQMEWSGHFWLEHTVRFTDNPYLARAEISRIPYPQTVTCESDWGNLLHEHGYHFAYWGKFLDPPRVEHIGCQNGPMRARYE